MPVVRESDSAISTLRSNSKWIMRPFMGRIHLITTITIIWLKTPRSHPLNSFQKWFSSIAVCLLPLTGGIFDIYANPNFYGRYTLFMLLSTNSMGSACDCRIVEPWGAATDEKSICLDSLSSTYYTTLIIINILLFHIQLNISFPKEPLKYSLFSMFKLSRGWLQELVLSGIQEEK